jgi:putative ABC transport system substrate-binding protein
VDQLLEDLTPPAPFPPLRSGERAGLRGATLDRRRFLVWLGLGAVAVSVLAPAAAWPQTPGRVHRLGILAPTTAPPRGERKAAVVLASAALAELGYVQGQNLIVETRYAGGNFDRLPALARELVQLRVDVIVAIGLGAIRAARAATTTIPIVFLGNFDPVAAGLVASLAKPGGNATGVLIAPEGTLAGKKLELLAEAVPRATQVAMLIPADPGVRLQVQEAQKAAAALDVKLVIVEARDGNYATAFNAIAAERPGALFVAAHTYFMRDRQTIIQLAAKHRLAAIYEWPEQVEDGGLMSYGASLTETSRRVAAYVDRVFKGAVPADLPIEQPTSFQLVINLKTARALGLTLPPSLVARADRVIE